MEGENSSLEMKTELQKKVFSEPSVSNEGDSLNQVSDELPPLKVEPETEEDAVLNEIKREERRIPGQFETVYLQPPTILPENTRVTRSKKGPKSSKPKNTLMRCRLCANRSDRMYSIFGTNKRYKNIYQKIKRFLCVTVKMTDSLPKYACRICLEKLDSFYLFYRAVEEAEARLLMYEQGISSDYEEMEDYCPTSSLFNKQDDQNINEPTMILEEDKLEEPTVVENNEFEKPFQSETEQLSDVELQMIDLARQVESEMEVDKPQAGSNEIVREEIVNKCVDEGISFTENRSKEKNLFNDKSFNKKNDNQSNSETDNKFVATLKLKFKKLCHKSNINPNRCKKCNKDMDSEISLREHLITAHQDDEEPDCGVSGKNTKNNEEQIATNEKTEYRTIGCAVCKMKFPSDVLRIHSKTCGVPVKVHKNTFSCDYCGKTCNRKLHLAAHMHQRHVMEKRYCCRYCGQKFVHETWRDTHEETHSGINIFQCSTCKESFNTYRKLVGHSRTHSTDYQKNYPCPECDKSFNTANNRKVHMRIHNSGDPSQCDICGSHFKYQRSLWRHKKCEHDIDERVG